MIPLRDLNPVRRTPVVNRLLLLANLAVWIYVVTLTQIPGAADAFYSRYAFDWSAFTTALAGGNYSTGVFVPLVAHMFVHGGWLHVLGNMLYLWIFGDNVEDQLGSVRYVCFYLACGVIAAVGQGLLNPAPMVGASGAIAGVLGAYLILFPGARVSTLIFLGIFISVVRLPAFIVIGAFILLQFLQVFAQVGAVGSDAIDPVAYFAHIVGFGAGIVLILLLRPRRSTSRSW